MKDYPTLLRTQPLVQGQGSSCKLGCTDQQLPEMIAYAKRYFPHKPYCVVESWTWVDIPVSAGDTGTGDGSSATQSILYAGRVIADEAHRPHLGPLVRTSPLCEFHLNCIFVTQNTVYILRGSGKRTSLSAGLVAGELQRESLR